MVTGKVYDDGEKATNIVWRETGPFPEYHIMADMP